MLPIPLDTIEISRVLRGANTPLSLLALFYKVLHIHHVDALEGLREFAVLGWFVMAVFAAAGEKC